MLDRFSELKIDSLTETDFIFLLENNKQELLKLFKKGKEDLINLSNTIVTVIAHAKSQQQNLNTWKCIEKIWETSGFIVLASLDLKTYLEILCTTDDIINQSVVIRMAYTQLYEISNDIDKLIGKDFFTKLEELNISNFRDEICHKKKRFNECKNKYLEDLKKVRMNIGAHREFDYVDFHQLICNLEYTPAITLILKFGNALNEIAETLQKIMNKSTFEALDRLKKI